MGSGKTTSAIRLMNAHPEQHFVYVTEILDEGDRIMQACPALKFRRPGYDTRRGKKRVRMNKSDHVVQLLEAGENVVTTHKLFTMFDDRVFEAVRERGYIMIIDEEPVVIENCSFGRADFASLEQGGYIRRHKDGTFDVLRDKFDGQLNTLLQKCRTHRTMCCSDKDAPGQMWTLRPDVFEAFKEIYIMTYLYQGSTLQYYMRVHDIPYGYIYIGRDTEQEACFVPACADRYLPEYVGRLHKLIHICEDEELNQLGDDQFAYSAKWLTTNTRNNTKYGKMMKSHLRRFFTELTADIPGEQRMWSTLADCESYLSRNGWKAAFVTYNRRAVNCHMHRRSLAYLMNVFMHPSLKIFLSRHNVTPDEDTYALAIFIQWIWRSAIRNGEEIWLYVPSKRMRTLLKAWITKCEDEYRQSYDAESVA